MYTFCSVEIFKIFFYLKDIIYNIILSLTKHFRNNRVLKIPNRLLKYFLNLNIDSDKQFKNTVQVLTYNYYPKSLIVNLNDKFLVQ